MNQDKLRDLGQLSFGNKLERLFIPGIKRAAVTTPLEPHQQRVIDRLMNQDGLVVAHGLGSGKTLSSIAAAEAFRAELGSVSGYAV